MKTACSDDDSCLNKKLFFPLFRKKKDVFFIFSSDFKKIDVIFENYLLDFYCEPRIFFVKGK
jgi:hypothetical protein